MELITEYLAQDITSYSNSLYSECHTDRHSDYSDSHTDYYSESYEEYWK